MTEVVFYVFAVAAVISATLCILQRNPVSAALWLVSTMFSLAAIYVILNAQFIAAIQVLVYAGAVMVLFVFVIMLLNAGEEERTKGSRVAMLSGIPGMLVGSVLVGWMLIERTGSQTVAAGALPGAPRTIGWLLFHNFLLPFEVTSILVLIAIMGAVVLASHPDTDTDRKES